MHLVETIRSCIDRKLVIILFTVLLIMSLVAAAGIRSSAEESSVLHIVQKGETLWEISQLYGMDVETIALLNNIKDPDNIKPGDSLIVSVSQLVDYTVKAGDTLWSIASSFGVSIDDIVSTNGIDDPKRLRIGTKLSVPLGVGGMGTIIPYIEYAVQRGDTLWDLAHKYNTTVYAISAANPTVNPSRLRIGDTIRVPSAGFTGNMGEPYIWPVSGGRITSEYGWRTDPFTKDRSFHGGVDIGLAEGRNIYASRSGVVVHAGDKGGYGKAVMIKHDDGITTLYGHTSKILVHVGQTVAQGQVIALVGHTGRATGSHVHFEMRKGDTTIDPMTITSPGRK